MTKPNYDFSKDLSIAIETEREIAEKFSLFYGHNVVSFCRDKRYDLSIVTKKGKSFTVEVKEDFTCEHTGNVGLEFMCRGVPSGISASLATHYVYKVHCRGNKVRYFIIQTKILKNMIERRLYKRIVVGGDEDSSSMNYLFSLTTFSQFATEIFKNQGDLH